jgi:hypothetical protein
MSTTGTYTFNPGLGEISLYAFMNIGIRPTSVLQEHMQSVSMAANMLLSRWANQGVNLWAVDLITTALVDGTATYDVDASTIMILDAYIVVNGVDRVIMPVSRTDYSSYPNKTQQGMPTIFWFNRLIAPTVTLWPVPDGNQTSLKYYRVRRIQDAAVASNKQVEIPYVWLEAFADALTYRLARMWAPQMAQALKLQADESYDIAARQNVENVNTYIRPMVSGYFRS